MYEQIFVGVLSGVITAALLYLVSKLITRWLIPAFESARYKGFDISGSWHYLYDAEDSFSSMQINMRQNAHDLLGDALVVIRVNGHETKYDYELKGTIWEGWVVANLKTKDRKSLSFATLLMKVSGAGESLLGSISMRNPATDSVSANEFQLVRK